jgi:hypothetical protein
MPEKPKSRIKNLSTRYLRFYKYGVGFIIVTAFAGLLFYHGGISLGESKTKNWFLLIYYSYFLYIWWRVNQKVFHVEFDADFMYVGQGIQDVLIPLENIKDVNLVSMGGVYRVDLYSKETFGDKFYFKPSLLYPFNHKKKEAVVDILWSKIEKAKRKKQDFQRSQELE